MRVLWAVPAVAFGVVALASTAFAQTDSTPVSSNRRSAVKFMPRFDVGFEYDNNIFLLPTSKKDEPRAPSAADLLSGRYVSMESASDIVAAVAATLMIEGNGLRGRDLILSPTVGYERYLQSADRSNLTLGLTLEQALRRDGRVRLRARLQPSYFSRNYLSDAIDGNVDGTITSDERRYARGEYRETEVQADYRIRLAKSSKAAPFGAFLILGAGFADRAYDAPLVARDFSGPFGSTRLQLDLSRRVQSVTSYDVAMMESPVSTQVILLDEPAFGEDLNGNANATDLNARAVRTVDRSRTEHVLGQTARFEATKDTDIEVSIDYRWRTFSSDEPYDVANNGRRDRRGQYGVDVIHRLSKAIRMNVGARYSSQQLNRRTDLGGEGAVDDYTKLQAHLGFRIVR